MNWYFTARLFERWTIGYCGGHSINILTSIYTLAQSQPASIPACNAIFQGNGREFNSGYDSRPLQCTLSICFSLNTPNPEAISMEFFPTPQSKIASVSRSSHMFSSVFSFLVAQAAVTFRSCNPWNPILRLLWFHLFWDRIASHIFASLLEAPLLLS